MIWAGAGNDAIHSLGGNDLVCAGRRRRPRLRRQGQTTALRRGRQRLGSTAATGNDDIDGGAGDDELEENEGDGTVEGGAGNDVLAGYIGNDTLNGGPGNDIMRGGHGFDDLYGGAGDDTIVARSAGTISSTAAPVRHRRLLERTGRRDGRPRQAHEPVSAGHDRLISIENVIGTRFDDRLIGDSGRQRPDRHGRRRPPGRRRRRRHSCVAVSRTSYFR